MDLNWVWCGICAKYLAFGTYPTSAVGALSIGNLVRENNGQTPFYASICSASMGSQ